MKKIPYGICNYRKLQEEGYVYVDKTMYLEKLEDVGSTLVYLRPGRFGKTLFTSMMYYYYDINSKDLFETLFKDTYVYKNPTKLKNNYYILKLDFSGMSMNEEMSSEDIENEFKNKVISGINNFNKSYSTSIKVNINNTPNGILIEFLSGFNNLNFDKEGVKEGLSSNLNNFEHFNFIDDGLEFIFPPYQIAYYAAGEIKIVIPYNELKGIIKNKYLKYSEKDNIKQDNNRDLKEFSNKKLIAFTFDDGPSYIGTNKLLDNLDKYNARVTLFLIFYSVYRPVVIRLFAFLFVSESRNRRQYAEVGVHRLEIKRTSGYVSAKRADYRHVGRHLQSVAVEFFCKRDSCNHTAHYALDVTFDTRQLPCYIKRSVAFDSERLVNNARSVYVGVAVHYAVSYEFGVVKSGNHAKNSLLLTIGEIRLKANKIVTISCNVFFSQLHDSVRFFARVGIAKSDGFERTETNGVASALRHLFYGHATVEKFALFKVVQ